MTDFCKASQHHKSKSKSTQPNPTPPPLISDLGKIRDNMVQLEGSCLCGAVRFRSTGEIQGKVRTSKNSFQAEAGD